MFDQNQNLKLFKKIEPRLGLIEPKPKIPLKSFGWLLKKSIKLFQENAGKLILVSSLFLAVGLFLLVIMGSFVALVLTYLGQETANLQLSLAALEQKTLILVIASSAVFLLLQILTRLLLQAALINRINRLGITENFLSFIASSFKKSLPYLLTKLLVSFILSAPLALSAIAYAIIASQAQALAGSDETVTSLLRALSWLLTISALAYFFWLGPRLFLANYLVLTDTLKTGPALKKSWQLTNGYWWPIFFRCAIFYSLLAGLGIIINMAIPLIGLLALILFLPVQNIIFTFLILQNLKLVKS